MMTGTEAMTEASTDNETTNPLLELQINGYTILPDVIPAAECGTIRQRLLDVVDRARTDTSPDKVGFVPGVINEEQSFAPYLADARLLGLLEQVLGRHLRISFTSVIVNETGNARGKWHADWPFNQGNAGSIPAPYPDRLMHITTLWMLSPFSAENGGTLVVPGSHHCPTNPTAGDNHPLHAPFPTERQAGGAAGSVLVMDSRLWHATAPNTSGDPRVALAVRYAPWWLNTEVLRPESPERERMCRESGKSDNLVPSLPGEVYDRLPAEVQPLYTHWVVRPGN